MAGRIPYGAGPRTEGTRFGSPKTSKGYQSNGYRGTAVTKLLTHILAFFVSFMVLLFPFNIYFLPASFLHSRATCSGLRRNCHHPCRINLFRASLRSILFFPGSPSRSAIILLPFLPPTPLSPASRIADYFTSTQSGMGHLRTSCPRNASQ